MDDAELIDKLLTRSEGKDLDFKSVPIITNNQKDKARFIKNLICMANTPREGSAYIISGVVCKQDGSKEIIGVPESAHPDDADLQGLIAGNVSPIPKFSYRPVPYSEKRIGILEIDLQKGGPFMPLLEYPNVISKGPIYFRRGSSNAVATSAEFREIIAWMDIEDKPLKHSRLIGGTQIDVGGSIFDYPCFFPSISSLRTQLKPLGYLRILRASSYPWFLVSAYDIYHSEGDDRNILEELLKETLANKKKVLLDCGYYESSWKNDKDWTEDKFWEILNNCEYSFAFTFDKKGELEEISIDDTVKEVVERWTKDSDVAKNGIIIPIVHHAKSEKFPQILQQVAKTINPVMIAVPERELGPGILASAKTVIKIREALNETGGYYPIHLLGTGNPLSMLIYAVCGADSFDGLEWCQMVLNHNTGLPHHLQHYDFFESQSSYRSIPGFSRDLAAMMHNLDFYLAWMKKVQEAIANGEAITLLREYLPTINDQDGHAISSFEMLKDKLPELFEGE